MLDINAQTMREIAPRFIGQNAADQAAIIDACGAALQGALQVYDITTRLRIAHFLGQTCHESAGFRTTEEFASGEAYEGREDLGNTQPGDGVRYKGRGLLQLTGRSNYRRVGGILRIDLEGHPERAAEPVLSLHIAGVYWRDRAINRACDQDDILTVTRLVNGGTNGLEDRRVYTDRARAVLAGIEAGALPAGDRPTLFRGSKGDVVAELQALLRKAGLPIAIDGDFGAGTEMAVRRFQTDHQLDADGIVGMQTWADLRRIA